MPVNATTYHSIIQELKQSNTTLVAVSKTKPVADILELYNLNQRDFGENYVQELIEKEAQLPKDIRWHFIGHLQSNKVKYIAAFVHLIHGVDSLNLLKEINKQAAKNSRIINCLLQIHIAQEETKFGFNESELLQLNQLEQFKNVNICGLMGMASFTDDMQKVKSEFAYLKSLQNKFIIQHPSFNILSMGMSSDYKIAIKEGSTMVRIGSLLFGDRTYNK
ncbi:MAG: YggS family pyridoxal phosphate-dependent enzyme [Bacteroidetes bacterium]|nr:YggS family pyridoxal phosphate-dependent enzyme [Bacteroidota bacterium]MBS1592562.1 YggS family pyridoxal phosphate-dependent enzyme [Bacteroidota bacterium]